MCLLACYFLRQKEDLKCLKPEQRAIFNIIQSINNMFGYY